MHMHRIGRHIIAKRIRTPINRPGLYPAAGHPHTEAAGMVVPPEAVRREPALAEARAPELTPPDHQRILEQSALLQISDQGGGGLVRHPGLGLHAAAKAPVVVPAGMVELNEAHIPLGQPTRPQAVEGEGAGGAAVRSVKFVDIVGLAVRIQGLRHGGLHPVGHLVLCDTCLDFRIVPVVVLSLVQGGHQVELPPPLASINAVRVIEVEYRVFATPQLHALVLTRQKPTAPGRRREGLPPLA